MTEPGTLPKTESMLRRTFAARQAQHMATLAGLGLLLGTLPGCQNVTGNQPISEVRIIDASPDAGGVDVYQGAGVLAYNLGLGTVTSYIPLSPGNYNIAVKHAGTGQQIVSAAGSFPAGGQRTVLITDYSTTLQEQILVDQTIPAPGGQVSLRFIDASTRGGTVDLYLVPAGGTIATARAVQTGVTLGSNSGYVNFPAGTYTLIAVPTGTVPTSTSASTYTGASVSYAPGSAKTIVLTDQQVATTPGLQVIIADDYNSPGAQ